MSRYTVVAATRPVTRQAVEAAVGDAIRYRSQFDLALPDITIDGDSVVEVGQNRIGLMTESAWQTKLSDTQRTSLLEAGQGFSNRFNIEGWGNCRYRDDSLEERLALYLVLVGLYDSLKITNDVTGTNEPVGSRQALFMGWGAEHLSQNLEQLGVTTSALQKRMKSLGGFL